MLGQVVHEQARDLELVDERAALVGGAGAVGIAVEQQPEVIAAGGQDRERLVDVGPDRLRVDAAEVRVALLVDLVDPDPSAGQQARDPAAARAPHRVDEDRQVGRPERVEVDGRAHEPFVARIRIEALDEPGRLGIGERPALDPGPAVDRELGLDDAEDVRARRGPGRRLDLEAVVDPRVVAGGDDDPGGGSALDHLERAHLGRDGVDREGDRDVVGEEDLGGGGRKVLRGEAAVVGDHDALARLAPIDDVARHAVGAAAHVLEGELVGDPGAPAVGPEHDRRGRRCDGLERHVSPLGSSSARGAARPAPGRGRRRAGPRSAAWRSSYRARAGR